MAYSIKNAKCSFPFEAISIDPYGNVCTCCPSWINDYFLGNIFGESLVEIWNGKKAQDLRASILDNSYKFCSREYCNYLANNDFEAYDSDLNVVMDKMPIFVKLSYDKECNIACRICRDEVIKNTKEEMEKLDNFFEKFILPALKDAKIITISAQGDPFGSRHSRKAIKKIVETYPNIKFDFHTNGILCDLNLLERLGVKDKIHKMLISVSAVTPETYGKMVINGEKLFSKLKNNLEMIGKLKKEQNFEYYIHFIVSSRNYQEMAQFIDFAESFGAVPCFWEFNFQCVWSAKNVDESWAITNKNHPEHAKLLEILKDKRFRKYKMNISPVLWNLIEEAQNTDNQ